MLFNNCKISCSFFNNIRLIRVFKSSSLHCSCPPFHAAHVCAYICRIEGTPVDEVIASSIFFVEVATSSTGVTSIRHIHDKQSRDEHITSRGQHIGTDESDESD